MNNICDKILLINNVKIKVLGSDKVERVYNKLLRDKIPEICKNNNEKPVVRTLNDEDFKTELEKKLLEEYNEVIESTGQSRIEELADMLEIIKSLAKLENKSLDDVIELANRKKEKRGAFEYKIFLEKVITHEE